MTTTISERSIETELQILLRSSSAATVLQAPKHNRNRMKSTLRSTRDVEESQSAPNKTRSGNFNSIKMVASTKCRPQRLRKRADHEDDSEQCPLKFTASKLIPKSVIYSTLVVMALLHCCCCPLIKAASTTASPEPSRVSGQEDGSQVGQALALIANKNNNAGSPTSSNTNTSNNHNTKAAGEKLVDSMATNSNNVIIIKYANVTASKQDNDDQTTPLQDDLRLNVYKLHGEPLSGSIIESRFANSIQLFDVSYNQLSTLPKDLFCPLSNEVRQLNISHNLLENFDCLGLISQAGQLCLSELRSLDMSFNLIKHLPATGVATLHNLEVLDLSHNLIDSLHELSLSSLFKLTKLDLSYNRVQQLPVAIFHKSSSMQVLKLQSNFIQTSITNQLLAGLVALEEINLSHNNISQVGELVFIDKLNLTRVDLTFNQLTGLKQDALRVTSSRAATLSTTAQPITTTQSSSGGPYKHRLHHNGQYAGVVAAQQTATPSNRLPMASNVEFLLSSNPFICDCNLEWLRKYVQTIGSLNHNKHHGQPHHSQHHFQANQPHHSVLSDHYGDSLGSQLMHLGGISSNYQNDQPVIHASSDPSNNISEMLSSGGQPNSRLATMLASGGGHHNAASQYGHISDLDLIKCSPLFRRNNNNNNNNQRSSHLKHISSHHHDFRRHNQADNMIDLLTADPSNFLCRYKSHCFAECHCCEFDACDCEMICPVGCQCYYDSKWHTNIIDCSSNNHTVVPDRIPMDVSGLYLDGNNIDSLRPSNLIARKSLKTLYLNASNLRYIANRTFNGLIELQTLYLNDNMLKSLNGHEFQPLAQLRALYLQSNRLDHISNETFTFLRSLEILDLSNNRLTSSNLDLFVSIGRYNLRLRQLSIAHNWWSCQCNSINIFRQILKQKFLLTGSVNIADKNQLRCYYSSTTVGPLILSDGLSSSSSSSSASSLQQPLYASYGGNRQQQTQLTEINQCSDVIEERPDNSFNPPVIYPSTPEILDQSPELSGSSNQIYVQDPAYPVPSPMNPFNQIPGGSQQQNPIMNSPDIAGVGGTGVQRNDSMISLNGHAGTGSMQLTTFLLLSILMLGAMAIAVSIFVFVRQQHIRFHQSRRHKKSSAASTTSASSSNASSATIDHHHHHHPSFKSAAHHRADLNHLHNHHTLLNSHQHHLIMNGIGGETGAQTMANHHHHSASSQSNIYAALVSPTTGNSTIVTSATSNMNLNISSAANNNNSNIYSNSSTTASHRSGNSSVMVGGHSGGGVSHPAMYWNGAAAPQQPTSVYSQAAAYGGAMVENPYAIGPQPQVASYKTGGSLYQTATGANCHHHPDTNGSSQQHEQQQGDWIRMPKVKQFMSKLVNKSLALGGYRTQSRDELSAITSSDKIYDAFISYDKRDETFVMQHLSAELEYGQPQYRIADRFRDLPLPTSAYIAEAITSVIGCSHRTIVVLTENYLSSEWCRYELQAALQESQLDRSHKIIAVVLDPKCLLDIDNEMRPLLTSANVSIYQPTANSSSSAQLVQLDGSSDGSQQQQHLVATLSNQPGANAPQQVCTQTAQLDTTRINFINYNERKFWLKLKQLMPMPRPSTQTLTLTTKN